MKTPGDLASILFVLVFGGGFLGTVVWGLYNLFRLRRRLYRCHQRTYEEFFGRGAGVPLVFGPGPGGREFQFLYKSDEDYGDAEVARLRRRVRRIPLYAVLVLCFGIFGSALLIIWQAAGR